MKICVKLQNFLKVTQPVIKTIMVINKFAKYIEERYISIEILLFRNLLGNTLCIRFG